MKTVKEAKVGDALLRVVEAQGKYAGVCLVNNAVKLRVDGESVDEIWRKLHRDLGQCGPNFFGFDGARLRFTEIFKEGFASQIYVDQERAYKIAAKEKLDRLVPLDSALQASNTGEQVLAVFRATNLLSPFEQTRMQEALRSPQADDFLHGAAHFTLGDVDRGLAEMSRALKPHNIAKWTALTYLPFLWRPDQHLFLKPEVCKDFAERVGHEFAFEYAPALDKGVYESLMKLAQETMDKIQDLGPRDFIDIQSFIWVVGKYDDNDRKSVLEADSRATSA